MRNAKSFYYFQAATLLNLVMYYFMQISMAWWCLKETGSAAAFASILGAATVANIISYLFFGWVGDEYDKKKVILYCHYVSLTVGVTLIYIYTEDGFSEYIITVLVGILGFLNGLKGPIQNSIVPELVEPDDVKEAIRLASVYNAVGTLGGPILGALFIDTIGYVGNIVFYIIITLCAVVILVAAVRNKGDIDVKSSRRRLITEAIVGIKLLIRVRTELVLSILTLVVSFTLMPLLIIVLPYWVIQHMNYPTSVVGLLEGAFGVGVLLSSIFIAKIVTKYLSGISAVELGFFLLSIPFFSISIFDGIIINSIALMVSGVGFVIINVNLSVTKALAVPVAYRNKIGAAALFIGKSFNPLAIILAGILIEAMPIGSFMMIYGLAILGCMFVVKHVPHLSYLLSIDGSEANDKYRALYPGVFDAMPSERI